MFNQRERIISHLTECYVLEESLLERVRPLVDRMMSVRLHFRDRAYLYTLLVHSIRRCGQPREEALAWFVFQLESLIAGHKRSQLAG